MEAENAPDLIVPIHDVVQVVEFSPYAWCPSLLCVGTTNRVIIISTTFTVDESKADIIRNFHHGCNVSSISWSPQTNFVSIPKCVKFATTGGDKKMRIFTSDLKEEDVVQNLEGHSDYINDVAFEPNHGEQLASVGDDYTCCIWSSEGTVIGRLHLTSPGTKVAWHTEEPHKLLVAEKKGVIRFYNTVTLRPLLSLDSGVAPLLSADWCLLDSLEVGCVAATEWFLWNTSVSSLPSVQKACHTGGGVKFSFCRINKNLIATRGHSNNTLKVENSKFNQVLVTANFFAGSGISWHTNLPIVAAGGDRKVCIWQINMV